MEIKKNGKSTQIAGNQFVFDAIAQLEEFDTNTSIDSSPFVVFNIEKKAKNYFGRNEEILKQRNFGILKKFSYIF